MLKLISNIRKSIITTSIVALLGVTVFANTAAAAQYNWRFSNLYGRGNCIW